MASFSVPRDVQLLTTLLLLLILCVASILATQSFSQYRREWARRSRSPFLSRFDKPPQHFNTTSDFPILNDFQNRAFASSIPIAVGDGLGHRFMMTNFELRVAHDLHVSYLHRASRYGSLTTNDPRAVDRMYGLIALPETRISILRRACSEFAPARDPCSSRQRAIVCKQLRPRAKGGVFDHLVRVPATITECYLSSPVSKCADATSRFASAHPHPNTLFQMAPSRCSADYRLNDWEHSRKFLRDAYWGFHARYGTALPRFSATELLARVTSAQNWKKSRALSLDATKVQIAIHVRRGDFFNYTSREIIPDHMYADVVCEVKKALDKAVRAPVQVVVNVYSEGVSKSMKDNHIIANMQQLYLDEHGNIKGDGHWKALIAERMRLVNGSTTGMQVRMHIASDTIMALHDMIAADFFIGSRSGMSMAIIQLYGRGVLLLPVGRGHGVGNGRSGEHLRFAWGEGRKRAAILEKMLMARVKSFVRLYKKEIPTLSRR